MKESNILVSIIVPVYGTEAYLPACIDSICNQTYKNIEIILVDDQSPDRCPEICDTYAKRDPRITVIHQENKGVSGARNTGLQYAKGSYIMFVDSDDILHQDAVTNLLSDARKYDADIVWAPQKEDKKNGAERTFKEETYTVFKGESSLLLLLEGAHNINSVWGKIFKAELIEQIFFEQGKNINEDGFFMFQCYIKKPTLIQHNISIYQYNDRADSSSRKDFSNEYLSMFYFCERKKEIISKQFPQYIKQAYNMEVRTHLQFLDVLCRTNEKKYRNMHKESVGIVRKLYKYHKPINGHHKMLAWIVSHGLYPIYKMAVRFKYYR